MNRIHGSTDAAQIQRFPAKTYNWVDSEDSEIVEGILEQLSSKVEESYNFVLNNPDDPIFDEIDGYTRRWLDVYAGFQQDGSREFIHAAFGYAIESYACKTGLPEVPSGYSIRLQATRGATRPDIVIKKGKTDLAWFDITSDAQAGHILEKFHSGWGTLGYIAELLYPSLDPLKLGLNGGGAQVQERNIARSIRMLMIREKLKAHLAKIVANIPEPYQGKGGVARQMEHIQNVLGDQLNGGERLTRIPALSVLVMAGKNPGHYGFKGKDAKGGKKEIAEEVIYQSAVQELEPAEQDEYNNRVSKLTDSLQPAPSTGLFQENWGFEKEAAALTDTPFHAAYQSDIPQSLFPPVWLGKQPFSLPGTGYSPAPDEGTSGSIILDDFPVWNTASEKGFAPTDIFASNIASGRDVTAPTDMEEDESDASDMEDDEELETDDGEE